MSQLQTRPSPFDRFLQQQPQQQNAAPVQGPPATPGSPFDQFFIRDFAQQVQPPAAGPMGPPALQGSPQAPQTTQQPRRQPQTVPGVLAQQQPMMQQAQFAQPQPQGIQGPFAPPEQRMPENGAVLGPTPEGMSPQDDWRRRYGDLPPGSLTPPMPGPRGLEGFGQNVGTGLLNLIPSSGRIGEAQVEASFQQRGEGVGGFAGDVVGSVIPSAVAAFFPPAAGPVLAAFAGSSAEQKLKDTGSPASALAAGTLEAGTEMIGLGAAMKFGVRNLGRVSRMLFKGETKQAGKILADAGILTAAEGGEEALNVIGTNIVDATLGLQSWEEAGANIQRDAPEAFKAGAAGALILGLAGLGGQAMAQRAATTPTRAEAAQVPVEAARPSVTPPPISPQPSASPAQAVRPQSGTTPARESSTDRTPEVRTRPEAQTGQGQPDSEPIRPSPQETQGQPSAVQPSQPPAESTRAGEKGKQALYHGTSKTAAKSIRRQGFRLGREHGKYSNTVEEYVSLTKDPQVAKQFAEASGGNVEGSSGEVIEIDPSSLKIADIREHPQGDNEPWLDYIARMRSEGFDAIDISTDPMLGEGEAEVAVINPRKLKLKGPSDAKGKRQEVPLLDEGPRGGEAGEVRPEAVKAEEDVGATRIDETPSAPSARGNQPTPAPKEIPRFATYAEAQEWIRKRHADFPSAQAYQATPEYEQLYPQISKLYEDERAAKDATIVESMAQAKIKYNDRVQFDYVTPWGAQQYTGTVVRRKNRPYVKFDAGQSTMSGQTQVRWHRGWTKESKATYAQLRQRAKDLGLSPVGSLAVLRERVRGATQQTQPTPAESSIARQPTSERQDQAGPQTEPSPSLPQTPPQVRPAAPSEPPGKGREPLRMERVPALFPRGKGSGTLRPVNSPAEFILKLAREDADFAGLPIMTFRDGKLIVRDGATYRFEPDAFGVDPKTPEGTEFFIDLAQMREHALENKEAVKARRAELSKMLPYDLRDAYMEASGEPYGNKSKKKPDMIDAVLRAEFGKPTPSKQPAPAKPAPDAAKAGEAGGPSGMGAMGSPARSLPSPEAIKSTRIQPAPLTGKVKPIKDIILDLESGIGQVRTGNPARGSIGTYYPGSSKTIIGFANDLDTTAHEVAHRLDDLYGIVADWATPRGISKSGAKLPQKSPLDAELRKPIFQQTIRKNYSVVKKRAEGVAEWMRAWMMNPDAAKREAPQFTKWFESKVPQNVRDRLRSFGDDIRNFAGASGVEKTTANVELGITPKRILDKVKARFETEGVGGTLMDKASAAWIDSLHPVWRGVELAKTLRGLKALSPSIDPKNEMRLFAGFDRKAMDVLENGPIDTHGQRLPGMGGINWLLEPIKADSQEQVVQNFQDVVAWGLSERVVERAKLLDDAVTRAEELERQISEARAAIRDAQKDGDGEVMGPLVDQLKADISELAQLKKRVGFTGNTERMRRWADLKKQRLSGVGGGVMSDIGVAKETLAEIAADPKRRERAEEGARRYRQWSDAVLRYMRDKGRISQAQYDAILANNNHYFAMKRQYETINDEFIRHGGRKLGSVARVVQKFKGSTRTIENPYVSLIEQTYAFMREADRNAAMRTFTDLLTRERSMYQGKAIDFDQIGSRAKSGDPDAISVFEDGKEIKWQFAPEIHRALKDFGKTPDQSIVAKLLQAPASLLRTMIVMSPDFMVRNQMRDPVARSIVSETGSKPWSQFYYLTPEGLSSFKTDLSMFRRMGGGLFGHNLVSRDDYYRKFADAFNAISRKRNTIITVPRRIVEGYRNFSEAQETIGRLAEYHRAQKKAKEKLGYGDEDAALYAAAQARDLQDFAVAGHAAREINRYVPFFNAAIRGVEKSVRSARANPTGFAARWMLYSGVPTLAFYLLNMLMDNEDEYAQLPSYQRDFFWNVKIGPDLWLGIPKPWELGVTASAIERAIDAARGRSNAFDGYLESLGSSASPIGAEGLVGPWRGLVEVMANYDFFRDKPIISPWEAPLELGLRKGDDFASRVGQLIQKAIGVDARNADHLIRSYLGGIGRTALTVSDIGRADKPGGAIRAAKQASGVLKSSPAAFSKDADWVSEYARRKGETSKKWYRDFRDLIDGYYTAEAASDRDKAAEAIRREATRLRKTLEP